MPEGYLYKERRISPRTKVEIPIQFGLLEDPQAVQAIRDQHKKARGEKAIDLSLGGLQVLAAQPLRSGDMLEMEISLPGLPMALPATAEVVWADGNTGGLHFLRMDGEDVRVLKAFLNKAMKSRGGA
ncbi:MAG TPA: PilZ domain-containing protein [bacterium]|nr:PilZ domain-containing protein [bacterium]